MGRSVAHWEVKLRRLKEFSKDRLQLGHASHSGRGYTFAVIMECNVTTIVCM